MVDGPVVFNIQDSSTTAHITFLPDTDTFTVSSLNILQQNKEDSETEPSDSRLYIYEVVGPNYSKVWVHSSLKQYIEARPWFVSILSMSLLSPTYYRNSLIQIPSNRYLDEAYNSIERDGNIANKLREATHMDAGHIVVSFENGTYYDTLLNSVNVYVKTEIPFLNHNSLIISSLIASILIGILGVISILKIYNMAYFYIENYYYQNIRDLRNFALARYNHFHKLRETKIQNSQSNEKILKLSMYSTDFMNKSKLVVDTNKKKKYEQFYWCAFKLIGEYIKYRTIAWSDSFYNFIKEIYATNQNFDDVDLVEDFEATAIRYDQLNEKYQEYCIVHGGVAQSIRDQEWTLSEYELQLKTKSDSTTEVFTNIRWKTQLEKFTEQKQVSNDTSNSGEQNTIKPKSFSEFLNLCCKPSTLSSDFILLKDLEKKYRKYCIRRNLRHYMHQNYIDSDELKLSGAVYSPSFQCEYVKGIASRKIPVEPLELNNKKKRYIRGMVRKKIADRRNWLSRILIFIRHTSYQLLTTPSGIILNLFIGVVHLLFLLLVPNVINIILLLSLLQITKIQDEIFFPVFTIGDCFNASSYSFWLHYLKGKYLVWIFCIVGIAYVAIGLLSLTSYYVTDGLNTGRYHTVVHPYKKLSDLIF